MARIRGLVGSATLALILVACGPESAPVSAPAEQAPQAPITCVGVPQNVCQQMLTDARRDARPGTVVVQMHIVCTQPPCTQQSGQTEAEIVYSDGQRVTFGTGWAGAAPPQGP